MREMQVRSRSIRGHGATSSLSQLLSLCPEPRSQRLGPHAAANKPACPQSPLFCTREAAEMRSSVTHNEEKPLVAATREQACLAMGDPSPGKNKQINNTFKTVLIENFRRVQGGMGQTLSSARPSIKLACPGLRRFCLLCLTVHKEKELHGELGRTKHCPPGRLTPASTPNLTRGLWRWQIQRGKLLQALNRPGLQRTKPVHLQAAPRTLKKPWC